MDRLGASASRRRRRNSPNRFEASILRWDGRSEEAGSDSLAQASGFSLHAGAAIQSDQRDRLERICRYVSRSAVANERLSRLASLVPKPKVNLTRFHGVIAPNHRLRAQIGLLRKARPHSPRKNHDFHRVNPRHPFHARPIHVPHDQSRDDDGEKCKEFSELMRVLYCGRGRAHRNASYPP